MINYIWPFCILTDFILFFLKKVFSYFNISFAVNVWNKIKSIVEFLVLLSVHLSCYFVCNFSAKVFLRGYSNILFYISILEVGTKMSQNAATVKWTHQRKKKRFFLTTDLQPEGSTRPGLHFLGSSFSLPSLCRAKIKSQPQNEVLSFTRAVHYKSIRKASSNDNCSEERWCVSAGKIHLHVVRCCPPFILFRKCFD